MARFNCDDCVKFCTDGCRFGANHRDYSEYCDDMLVEQDHAYEKAIDDFAQNMKDVNITKAFIPYCNHQIDLEEFMNFASDEIAERLKENKND